jgi:Na+/proline symporter
LHELNYLDYTVIAVYFLILIAAGFYLSTRASKSLEDYFLGGRKLPWWAMGMSGTASWFDITGTMLIVSFLYMLGPRGIYIEFRGGACLILAFMMIFTGKWHRRSGCITAAEWMVYRFGEGPGGQFARISGAIGMMIMTVGMLAYMIKGVGLFLSMFIPLSPVVCAIIMIVVATIYTMASGFYGVVITDVIQTVIILIAVFVITFMAIGDIATVPDFDAFAEQVTGRTDWSSVAPTWEVDMPRGYETYEALMMFALFYLAKNVLLGLGSGGDPRYFGARNEREAGLLSWLWGWLIMIRWPMMIGFAVIGMFLVHDFYGIDKTEDDRTKLRQAEIMIKRSILQHEHPEIDHNFEKGARLATIMPPMQWMSRSQKLLEDPESDPTTLERLKEHFGPDWPQEVSQIAQADKLVREAIPRPRWEGVLASIINRPEEHDPQLIANLKELLGEDEFRTKMQLIGYEGTVNPERILPAVLLHRIPAGMRGLLLIALIAASMSTFDTNVNMATGFFTRDLYQRYFRRAAGNRELMLASYAFGVFIVICGFTLAYSTDDINDIWGWLIMSLTSGLAVPGIVRLYWWRFNAGGVVGAALVGSTSPFIQRVLMPDMDERVQFVVITLITFTAAVIGTLLSKPTHPRTLTHFYRTTRPFGWWGPLKKTLSAEAWEKTKREHRNDLIAIPFVLVWQVTLFMVAMQLVVRAWDELPYTIGVFLVALAGVYWFWYRNLPPAGPVLTEEEVMSDQEYTGPEDEQGVAPSRP